MSKYVSFLRTALILPFSRVVLFCIALIFWRNLRESLLFGATTWEMREYSFMVQSQKPRQTKRKKTKKYAVRVCVCVQHFQVSTFYFSFSLLLRSLFSSGVFPQSAFSFTLSERLAFVCEVFCLV